MSNSHTKFGWVWSDCLRQSNQSKTSYKYMICHVDKKCLRTGASLGDVSIKSQFYQTITALGVARVVLTDANNKCEDS